MKKKEFGLILAVKDYLLFHKLNKELIDELSASFEKISVINLSNFKFRNQSGEIKNFSKFPKNFRHITFKNSKEFLAYFKDLEFIGIQYLSKNPDFYKIFFLIKLAKIKNIMIMNLGIFGNKITPSFNKKNIFAFKHYYDKGFYYLFRILTIINIFPKIDLLLDSNVENIKAVNNGLSRKFENKFPFFKISYFRNTELINSISYDQYMSHIVKKEEQEEKYILYIDVPIRHPDRILREGEVEEKIINEFYSKLTRTLKYFSKIFDAKVLIAMHPSNKKNENSFFSEFEITSKRSMDLVPNAEIIIVTHSSLISNAVMFKKKLISINSKTMGDYLNDLTQRYQKSLNLFSVNIDNDINVDLTEANKIMNISISNYYEKYINQKLKSSGNQLSRKQIVDIIKKRYFE